MSLSRRSTSHVPHRVHHGTQPLASNHSHPNNFCNVDPNFCDLSYNNFVNNHPLPIMPPCYEYPHTGNFPIIPSVPPHQRPNHNYYPITPCHYFVPQFPQTLVCSSVQRPLPPEDLELYPKIVKQIEYYFSKQNLVGDIFLRKKMDRQGWVDVFVIAEFRRMKQLTQNVHHILEALATSDLVQVKGYKMRVRYNWKKWILPPNYLSNGVEELTQQVQRISIGNTTNNDQQD
ncbi:la-related protein 1C-like [Prosopis cineraria]|uniref:la-related protein 1C-like n=1 Tax=Prosopis cineraria TaxID=364024 RepID=UPI00241046F2|nr:la-related protein 1C-like [Prosopis cineraria]